MEPRSKISYLVNTLNQKNYLNSSNTSLCFLDSDSFANQIRRVQDSFPDDWIHASAVKTNPLVSVLRYFSEANMALEAASFEEVCLAHHASEGKNRIVWDSPVKTMSEYQQVLGIDAAVIVNFNSLGEYRKISPNERTINGLRINPQIKPAAHSSMSVGGQLSKFGEPISNKAEIIQAFQTDDSLVGIHVHTSSQTSNYQSMVDGIRKAIDLLVDIEETIGRKLRYIDIGGGFPVDYSGADQYEIADFASLLEDQCPELFTGRWEVVTEFGRYYHAHAGVIFSVIEDKTVIDDQEVWMIHSGADILMRECYQVGQWPHRLEVYSKEGTCRQGEKRTVMIGGPLCFGGDYPFRNTEVNGAEKGDYLVILDSGANSWALWSHHCSRSFPLILMGSSKNNYEDIRVIRRRDTINDHLIFWGGNK